jgi:monofunctional biosynthetic peptidoglycan transglycosylase
MRRWARAAAMALAAGFWFLAWAYLTLPDVRPLRAANPESTAFIERRAADARAAGRPFVVRQRWVPYPRIASHLKRAVLVAEDSAFWQHDGVDLAQVRESLEVNLERREFVRGASTITQQLAKNLYLSPSRNPVRKLRELMIARRLEAELSKRRILEIYLNVIEWGDGIFGAEAAARAYFGVPASALGPEQSALLAGAIINPRVLNPASPTPRLRARQRLILRRMGPVAPPPDEGPAVSAPASPEVPEPPPDGPAEIPDEPDDSLAPSPEDRAPDQAPDRPPAQPAAAGADSPLGEGDRGPTG